MEPDTTLAVEAFARDHHGCGTLMGDTSEPGPHRYSVAVACSCGARLLRRVSPDQAERELIDAG